MERGQHTARALQTSPRLTLGDLAIDAEEVGPLESLEAKEVLYVGVCQGGVLL